MKHVITVHQSAKPVGRPEISHWHPSKEWCLPELANSHAEQHSGRRRAGRLGLGRGLDQQHWPAPYPILLPRPDCPTQINADMHQ